MNTQQQQSYLHRLSAVVTLTTVMILSTKEVNSFQSPMHRNNPNQHIYVSEKSRWELPAYRPEQNGSKSDRSWRKISQTKLDMVSKFVEEDLSLGMYMEAGFYQLLSSVQSQTTPIKRRVSKKRIRIGSDPLQLTIQEEGNEGSNYNIFQSRLSPRVSTFTCRSSFTTEFSSITYTPCDILATQTQEFSKYPPPLEHDLLQKNQYSSISLELIGDVSTKNPAFVRVMPTESEITSTSPGIITDRIWMSSFSLLENYGGLHSLDAGTGCMRSVTEKNSKSMFWPNESVSVPDDLLGLGGSSCYTNTILISDGFLVPGKSNGGLYVIHNPTEANQERIVCLTGGSNSSENWFYHKAVWTDITGDGRKSIITARAKIAAPSFGKPSAEAQLVWLELPKPHTITDDQIALEEDGSPFNPFHPRHLPWKSHILDEGPDVMFAVADLDCTDDTIEVISSEFFDRKVTIRSIQRGTSPRVVFSRVIDDKCGAPFSAILADLDDNRQKGTRLMLDSGSTVAQNALGDSFSHILVTSQPCAGPHSNGEDSGALFAYRVPDGDWKTEPWTRSTVATGFKVRTSLWNMINPGAPGFVYTFFPQQQHKESASKKRLRPMIAIAGDCSESAYLFQPIEDLNYSSKVYGVARRLSSSSDLSTKYKLVCEIKTGATVGSIGIGYGSFGNYPAGHAKLYIPLFEKNKMLVFALDATQPTGDTSRVQSKTKRR
jgi:hypothetical protein